MFRSRFLSWQYFLSATEGFENRGRLISTNLLLFLSCPPNFYCGASSSSFLCLRCGWNLWIHSVKNLSLMIESLSLLSSTILCNLAILTGSFLAYLKIDRVYACILPIIIAYCIHLSAIPNRKSRVIFKSHGRLTKIFPRAVIFGTYIFWSVLPKFAWHGGGTVNAPVCYKFLVAL